MLSETINRDRQTLEDTNQSQGFDYKVVLFVAMIILLIIWSFWGKTFQRDVYGPRYHTDDIGAEFVLSYPGDIASNLVVGQVYLGSPADLAGLKTGDQILGLDGKILTSPAMAVHILKVKKKGSNLKITVLRNNKNMDIYLNFGQQALRNKDAKTRLLSPGARMIVILVFLKLSILMFFFVYKKIENRMHTVLLFAMAMLVAGFFFKVYSPVDALFSIKFNTISLLLGMGIISVVLDHAGFFDYAAYRIYEFSGGNRYKILILFCLITYFFSLLLNNLTTILVVVPMTLSLAAVARFDPRPIVIGEVISSNIGGASTMVGDFPNMLISSEAGIGFNQFIFFMMPICIILFAIMLLFLKYKLNDFGELPEIKKRPQKIIRPVFSKKDKRAIRRALFILCHVVFLFIISERISLNPSAIALFGGLSIFLFSGMNKGKLIRNINFNDILFFIGLFIIVGGLEAAGILQYISKAMMGLSFGKPWLLCLILMWQAAFLTAFLSAGPTTAFFIPVVIGVGMMPDGNTIWWALSLGVLSGSSASIMGATAGPVATTLVENFSSRHMLNLEGGNTITSDQFLRIGIPLMLIFLIVSSFYILWLCGRGI